MLLTRINPDALARELTHCGGWKIDDLRQRSGLSWGTLAAAGRGDGISPESAYKIGDAIAKALDEPLKDVLHRLLAESAPLATHTDEQVPA